MVSLLLLLSVGGGIVLVFIVLGLLLTRQGQRPHGMGQRVTQLEAEVEQLKDQVADAVIAADERQWDRLDQAGTPTVSDDA